VQPSDRNRNPLKDETGKLFRLRNRESVARRIHCPVHFLSICVVWSGWAPAGVTVHPGATVAAFTLSKRHADPFFLAPNYVALAADIAGRDVQRNFVWNADRTRNLESSAGARYIANYAIDSGTVELDRSGLEYPLSRCCTSLGHFVCFKIKV
jgi:hypothetical protein